MISNWNFSKLLFEKSFKTKWGCIWFEIRRILIIERSRFSADWLFFTYIAMQYSLKATLPKSYTCKLSLSHVSRLQAPLMLLRNHIPYYNKSKNSSILIRDWAYCFILRTTEHSITSTTCSCRTNIFILPVTLAFSQRLVWSDARNGLR